jgi:hypothetical protein
MGRYVAEQGESGQSVRAYCGEHGLDENTFSAWRQRVARRKRTYETRSWRRPSRVRQEARRPSN